MNSEYPRSFYVHIVWNYLDDKTGKDCEVILELLVGESIEIASKTVTRK